MHMIGCKLILSTNIFLFIQYYELVRNWYVYVTCYGKNDFKLKYSTVREYFFVLLFI